MPKRGGVWYATGDINQNHAPLWTKEEELKLYRAFIDLDLDGPALYKWCKDNGLNRTPGAIDQKLTRANFFKLTPPPEKLIRAHVNKDRRYAQERANRNLRNQIELAKLEAETAPLFKPPENEI